MTQQISDAETIADLRAKLDAAERELNATTRQLLCMRSVADLEESPGITMDELFPRAASCVTGAMQFPEQAGTRIIAAGRAYTSDGWSRTPNMLEREIEVEGLIVGKIQVCYGTSESFLEGEGQLLDMVADGLASFYRRKRAEEALQRANEELRQRVQEALEEIRTLRGIVPICSNCKKIRDDSGYWEEVEIYVRDHSEAEFSHSICPECMKKLYPYYASGDT